MLGQGLWGWQLFTITYIYLPSMVWILQTTLSHARIHACIHSIHYICFHKCLPLLMYTLLSLDSHPLCLTVTITTFILNKATDVSHVLQMFKLLCSSRFIQMILQQHSTSVQCQWIARVLYEDAPLIDLSAAVEQHVRCCI